MSTTNEYISRALANLNITQLNPMQEATLSASYHQRDIVLLSATGSGKTLSFLLPLLHLLTLDSSRPQALILAPSRELALQIEDVFKAMKSPWKCCCCYGGHPIALERRSIEGNNPEVIIGTPGRITDHLRKGYIDPRGIRTLVIDEFDKSLEFGFHDDMAQIIDELRGLTKKILLSATDSEQIPEFTGVSQIERLDFLPHTDEQESRLTLRRVISSTRDKSTTLGDLLCLFGDSSTIVFCNHRDAVDRITDRLLIEGFSVIGFHGAMEQPERERALFRFKTRGCNILISTDLAARGLDISQVEQVIHYQLPSTEDSYIHRNGRTARWDARGDAYLLLCEDEYLPEYINQDIELFELPDNIPHPHKPQWDTLYFSKGKKDKLNKMDIAGFLYKVGGLNRDDVGTIHVSEFYALVSIRTDDIYGVLERIRTQKIKGKRVVIDRSR